MKPKICLLLALFCLLLWSFQPAMILAQEQLSYVQWSPFPDLISAKTSSEIVLFSPELEEIDRWRIVDGLGAQILYYAWNHTGERLAIALSDSSLQIWNTTTKHQITHIQNVSSFFLSWSYDDHYLSVLRRHRNEYSLLFIDKNGALVSEWSPDIPIIEQMVWHPSRLEFITLTSSGDTALWDATHLPPQHISDLLLTANPQTGIAFNANGNQIAFSPTENANTIHIYDLQTQQNVNTLVNSVKYFGRLSWQSAPLTTYSFQDGIRVWDADAAEATLHIPDLERPLYDSTYLPSWNPDGTTFVYNDAEIGIHIRDGRTGAILARMDDE